MATFTKRVGNTNDDGHKKVSWDTSIVYIGHDNFFGDLDAAFRFNSVTIPQGSTITSAKLTLTADGTSSADYHYKIIGIDEDDTADFSSDPMGRTQTSAQVDWDKTGGFTDESTYDTADITSIVQEIVNRGGWSSGNDMGIFIFDDGTSGTNYQNFYDYGSSTTKCALLTINYSGTSPSASISLSPSFSPSPSSSLSRSPSITPSSSPSASLSPSPSPMAPFRGLRVAKPGKSVLMTDRPYDLKFDSSKGTLKYFSKQTINTSLDANAGEIGCTGEYTHNLGYYPFCEVFVRVYIGSPAGNYEYVPFYGAGASVLYSANYKITTTKIVVYGMIDGVSSSVWNFDFLVFIYKNNLQLS